MNITRGNPILRISCGGGGGGELGLAVSAIFLNRFFGACANKRRFFGFGVHRSLRTFSPKHLVFGIRKKAAIGFQIWYPMWLSVLSYLV